MKRVLAFTGLFVLFFTSNLQHGVEGSLLQPPMVVPGVMNPLGIFGPLTVERAVNCGLPDPTLVHPASEIETLRWAGIFA